MNSRELVNVTDCDVQYEEINTVINHAVDLLDDYKVFAYAPKHAKEQHVTLWFVVDLKQVKYK